MAGEYENFMEWFAGNYTWATYAGGGHSQDPWSGASMKKRDPAKLNEEEVFCTATFRELRNLITQVEKGKS